MSKGPYAKFSVLIRKLPAFKTIMSTILQFSFFFFVTDFSVIRSSIYANR